MFLKRPLLCVFGQNLDVWHMIPDDDVCDYAFYTEVFLVGDKLVGYFSPTSFTVFVEAARNYSSTQFGFSFHQT